MGRCVGPRVWRHAGQGENLVILQCIQRGDGPPLLCDQCCFSSGVEKSLEMERQVQK